MSITRRMTVAGVAIVALAAIGIWSTTLLAQDSTPRRQVNITQPVTDDVVTAGTKVRIHGQVTGDVATAGETVAIDAPVTGYVMSAARTVTLAGPVGNDVWAAGETVDVASHISNNAMMAGREVHLRPEAVVGHDAHLAGSTVVSEGRIEHDLKIGATTAQIGGEIVGNVQANAQKVSVMPGAVIQGDLIVRSTQPPEVSPQAEVRGQVRYEELRRGGWLQWPWMWGLSFVALLLLGFAALALSSKWPTRVSQTMTQRFGRSIAIGLALIVLVPVVVALLAVTVVGIPLAVVLAALYASALLLSIVFVAFRIGAWLMDRLNRPDASPWARMTVGVFVVSLAVSLPIAGWVIAMAVLIVGAGALAIERRDARFQMRASGLA